MVGFVDGWMSEADGWMIGLMDCWMSAGGEEGGAADGWGVGGGDCFDPGLVSEPGSDFFNFSSLTFTPGVLAPVSEIT